MADDNGQAANGTFAGLPKWARVVGILGFPVAAAAYLLYILLGGSDGVSANVKDIKDAQSIHIQQSDDHHKEFHEAEDRRAREAAILRELVRANCNRDARTTEEKRACSPETNGTVK